jgi:hypothetical protein
VSEVYLSSRSTKRFFHMTVIFYFLVFVGGAVRAVDSPKTSAANPFANEARFAVDSEADPSSARPELLHPRLSLSSVVATIEPDKHVSKCSLVEVTFFSFPFTREDMVNARNGNIWPLLKKSDAINNKNPTSAQYKNGGWASVQLTLDQHLRVREVRMTIPGYSILLSGNDLRGFPQEYQFDGKKLKLKSKGSYRLGKMRVGVAGFAFRWEMDLTIPVFACPKSCWHSFA